MPHFMRLSSVGLVLSLFPLPAMQAAGPEAVDIALHKPPPRLRPIEAVYEKIRIDMPAKELLALMKPFEELDGGHYQWRTWTDAQTQIHVSLFLTDGPHPVAEKSIYRRVVKDGQFKWVQVNMTPRCLVFMPAKATK
jgi:hypothetical protein